MTQLTGPGRPTPRSHLHARAAGRLMDPSSTTGPPPKTQYGFAKLAMVILMVVFVHFIEAYGLNPAIYSAHLKLHPLIVLAVLFVAEHCLGVWGLLLAVPLTVFTIDYCIRYPERSVAEVAKAELEAVQKTIDFEEEEDEQSTDLSANAAI